MSESEPRKSISIPILSKDLTTMTFVVPVDFAQRVELHGFRVIEAMRIDGDLLHDNQLMQVMSFIIQTALGTYLDQHPDDDVHPPEIAG